MKFRLRPTASSDLERLLGSFVRENSAGREHSISQVAGAINEGLVELGATHPRVGMYFERLRVLESVEQEYFIYSAEACGFAQVATFADTFNLEWFVLGRAE